MDSGRRLKYALYRHAHRQLLMLLRVRSAHQHFLPTYIKLNVLSAICQVNPDQYWLLQSSSVLSMVG